MNATNPQIARTIQKQIGRRTFAMLGVHTLVDHGNGLSFKFKGSKTANYMRILLDDGTDTYSVEFRKLVKWDSKLVGEFDGVHAGQLHELIESTTGLCTSL